MGAPGAGAPRVEAAILAGGLGTRLAACVADRPKVLADVRGRPFLTYLLDQLAASGVERAVLCTGYRGDMVEAALGARRGALELAYSREREALGTGGALRLALGELRSKTVLVLNGDSFVEADLRELCAVHGAGGALGTLLLTEVEDAGRYGRVELDGAGRISAFREKSAGGRGWINAGVYALERELLERIPAGRKLSLERDILPGWVPLGLRGHVTRGRFIDIGTPESYAAAQRFFGTARDQARP
jgi:NDP-sugar pyrophosphorylase family protein